MSPGERPEGSRRGWDYARGIGSAGSAVSSSVQKSGPGGKQRLRRTLLLALAAAGAVWLSASFMQAPAGARGGHAAPAPQEARQAGALDPAATQSTAPAANAADPQLVTTSSTETPAPAGAEPSQPPVLQPAPACAYGDQPALLAHPDQWQYTLLDTTYRLDPEYVPPELVSLSTVLAPVAPGQYVASEGHQLRPEAARALVGLFREAEEAGVQLAVQSAYRSYEYQRSTFEHWVAVDGYEVALLTSARAGHSEHQLGTAVDLRSRHGPPAWDLEDWAATPEGAWVAANAHRHGFVMSYPRDEEARSCYSYEPWHFRYVGPELAATLHATDEPPRLHLWRNAQQMLTPEPNAEETP